MTIKFVLLVNKQGQTRLAKYTDQSLSVEERRALEGEIVRKCLARSEKQVSTCALSNTPQCTGGCHGFCLGHSHNIPDKVSSTCLGLRRAPLLSTET